VGRAVVSPGRCWRGLFFFLFAWAATPRSAPALTVPDVPYLRQSEALCGGAALAMVLRYWGLPDIRPEEFAGSLTADGTGIPVDALPRLAEARGFRAFAFGDGEAEAIAHLQKGRPLIALLSTGPGRHHYVVMLAWSGERVLIHDPAVGPFRILAETEWRRRWAPTDRWALLVLPPEGFASDTSSSVTPSSSGADAEPAPQGPCAALVQPGVDLALAGELEAAHEHLAAAASWCPDASAPLREMAALEFRRERWPEAASLASEAVGRDPQDKFAWKLLATSQFVAGRRQEALSAWNRVDEPRLDLVQIDGFERTPARVVYDYLGEKPGTLLTPERLRRVERRMAALPAAQIASVGYRPLSGGAARLEVNVVERRPFSSPRSIVLQSAVHAVSERALVVDAFGLAPSGDSVRVLGHWQPNRARGALSASAPRFLSLPGVVTAEAMWDRQSYRSAPEALETAVLREQRQRASLSLAHWWAADTRAVVTVAADDWSRRGRHLSLSAEVEERLPGDHVAVGGNVAGWWSGASAPFYAASGRGSIRTRAAADHTRLRVDVAYDFASRRAPLALWSGAGTGAGRTLLLRAHPLLRDGVVDGEAFGRRLVSGTAEAETPLGSLGPAPVRAVAFVDAVKILAPARRGTLVDIGAGLRLQPPGWRSALRVDLATPWGRLHPHLSAGWQWEWR
jgi:hypothetical protein